MAKSMDIARIEIIRTLSDEPGGDVVTIDCTEGLSMVEGLGMLELAKDTWLRTNALTDEDED